MVTEKKRSAIPLENLAEEALKEAVAEVIAEHKLTGYPLAVWKNGRVVHLSPEQIEVRERPEKNKLEPVLDFLPVKMRARKKNFVEMDPSI